MSPSSSHFPACFRPSTDRRLPPLPPPSPPPLPVEASSNNTNLTTCLYQTTVGLFSLTWSRSFFGHSLHLLLHPSTTDHHGLSPPSTSAAAASFHLHLKPFTFWKKQGSKELPVLFPNSTTQSHVRLFWDLTKAKFGSSGSEPVSNFYLASVVDHELILLVGDLTKQALSKAKPLKERPHQKDQLLLIRREHVFGNKVFKTRAKFGGKNREITIDCSLNSNARLSFSVDKDRVLLIKRLKWKFRGNEKVEVDGVPINISWDVYNWLFQGSRNNGHAVFMLKFETLGTEEEEELVEEEEKGMVMWKRKGSGSDSCRVGFRRRTTERSSSSSSISMSPASSSSWGGSSIMEWSSVEENELVSPVGFSLLVYAWRK